MLTELPDNEVALPPTDIFLDMLELDLVVYKRTIPAACRWLDAFLPLHPGLQQLSLHRRTGAGSGSEDDPPALWIPACIEVGMAGARLDFMDAWDSLHVAEVQSVTWRAAPISSIVSFKFELKPPISLSPEMAIGLARYMPQLSELVLSGRDGGVVFTDPVSARLLPSSSNAVLSLTLPLVRPMQADLPSLLGQLPALRDLALICPLSNTVSSSLLACSDRCFASLVALCPGLRATVADLGGFRTVNALITEIHLARLRSTAPALSIGTRVEWSMTSD